MKNIFAVSDTDESLKGKGSGEFGLNQGVFFTEFVFNPNAGKDNSAADAIDINIMVNGKEYRRRLYNDTGALYNKKNEKIEPGQPGYLELYEESMTQKIAVVRHALKALGVQEATINALAATFDGNVPLFMSKMVGLVPVNYKQIPVDVFLEYQWEISDGFDTTFVELPKNMKGEAFLCPAQKGKFTPIITEEGELVYQNAEGMMHPFKKTKNFMSSNKAKQQSKESQAQAMSGLANAAGIGLPAAGSVAPGNGGAKQGNW